MNNSDSDSSLTYERMLNLEQRSLDSSGMTKPVQSKNNSIDRNIIWWFAEDPPVKLGDARRSS
ncbi:MAG: hypothetical protein H3Z50_01060 [archaeon]|nr:hypothetical protein [archaeon]MCP8305533.1 hypothetical protein [archaeon]